MEKKKAAKPRAKTATTKRKRATPLKKRVAAGAARASGRVSKAAKVVRKKASRAKARGIDPFVNLLWHQSPRHPRAPGARAQQQRVFWSTGLVACAGLIALITIWRTTYHRNSTPAPEAAPPAAAVVAPTSRSSAVEHQAVAPAHETALPGDAQPTEQLNLAFDQAATLPVAKRMGWWARWLTEHGNQGAWGALHSLGQGPANGDTAPFLPKRFDCTTFVETVIALARSERPEHFFDRLIAVRYHDGGPSFLTRNHFPEADWIPHNVRLGMMTDVTAEVAGAAHVTMGSVSKVIDRVKWFAQQGQKFKEISRTIASVEPGAVASPRSERVQVSYIPIAAVERDPALLPDGVIVNFVRPSEDRRPVLITHQGVVVKEGGRVMLRHATVPSGKVRVVLLTDYLKRKAGFIGVTLNRVNDPVQGVRQF